MNIEQAKNNLVNIFSEKDSVYRIFLLDPKLIDAVRIMLISPATA